MEDIITDNILAIHMECIFDISKFNPIKINDKIIKGMIIHNSKIIDKRINNLGLNTA